MRFDEPVGRAAKPGRVGDDAAGSGPFVLIETQRATLSAKLKPLGLPEWLGDLLHHPEWRVARALKGQWQRDADRTERFAVAWSGRNSAKRWIAGRRRAAAWLGERVKTLSDPGVEVVSVAGRPRYWAPGNRVTTVLIGSLAAVCLLMTGAETAHVAAVAKASGARWVQGGPWMPYIVSAMAVFGLGMTGWVWSDRLESVGGRRARGRFCLGSVLVSCAAAVSFAVYSGGLAGRASPWEQAPTTVPTWLHHTLSIAALSVGLIAAKKKIVRLHEGLRYTPVSQASRDREAARHIASLRQIERDERLTVASLGACQAALRQLADDRRAYLERGLGVHRANVQRELKRRRVAKERREGVKDYDEKVRQQDELARVIQFHPHRHQSKGA